MKARVNRFPILSKLSKDLRRSEYAQMPFSIAAALLLLLSGMSIALIYKLDSVENESPLPSSVMMRMKQTAYAVSGEMEEMAYTIAIETMKTSDSFNETMIYERFRNGLHGYIESTFPKTEDELKVNVTEECIVLRFLRMEMGDLLYGEGTLPTGYNYSFRTVPAYFFLSGNFTLIVEGYGGVIVHKNVIERKMLLPFPLISGRLESIFNALSGGISEFENLIRYQLGALAQMRFLNGYGFASRDGENGTGNVVTEGDVIRAANLALLLEEKKYLRDVDISLKRRVINSSRDPDKFGNVLEEVLAGGTADPADLFLLLSDEKGVDLGTLFAQSLYAVSDMIVLKWLEFMHVLDVTEGVENLLTQGQLFLRDVIESVTDIDLNQNEIVSWVADRMEANGYPPEYYRYMHYGWPDGIISIPEQKYTVFNDLNETYEVTIGGMFGIDFPDCDILSSGQWGDFLVDFQKNRFQLGELLQGFVRSVSSGIALSAGLPIMELRLDPFDDHSFLDEVEFEIGRILSDFDWFGQVISDSMEKMIVVDPLAEALVEFIESRWKDLFYMNESINAAICQVADSILNEIEEQIPDFGSWSRNLTKTELRTHLARDTGLGIRDELEGIFTANAGWRLDLLKQVFNGYTQRENFAPVSGFICQMVRGALDGIPALESLFTSFITRQIGDIKDAFELRSDRIILEIPSQEYFEFEFENGVTLHEKLRVLEDSGFFALESGDSPAVEIIEPWRLSNLTGNHHNMHITDIDDLTLAPYISEWTIEINGVIRIGVIPEAMSPHFLIDGRSPGGSVEIPVKTVFTLSPVSGWALRGVDYTPTSSLFGEICKFMENVWKRIVDGLKFISDGILKLFDYLKNVFSTLISYSINAIGFLAGVLQSLVGGLQKFIEKGAGEAIKFISRFIESVMGELKFNFTLFGLHLSIETNVPDLALGFTKDILKVSLSLSSAGASVYFSNRIVRLGNGDYDIIVNSTLSSSDWSVSMVVDPLMKIFNHFVEIKGLFNGHALLLYLPEVVQFQRHIIALSQVPGLGTFLSNIPTPIAGAKAKIDAGLEIKFNEPFMNHPVINEYEQNPPGIDRGAEWIELYNPTDRAISLDGWSIETSHGTQELENLGDISLMPYSRLVYTFDSQTLDNKGERKFPLTECIILKDANGNRVDSTPWTTDVYNDDRTWQRAFDGSDRWEFRESTKGSSNGKRMAKSSEIDFIKKAIMESAAQAIGEIGEIEPSLNALAQIIERTIDNFIERCIKMLASCIVEIRLFIEVSLQDLSSSIGAGFTLSIVITEKCVEETIRWIADGIYSAIKRLTNPLAIILKDVPVERLAENIFIRFAVFGRAGLPAIITGISSSREFRMETIIEANLACFGAMADVNLGTWRLGFGVVLADVPSSLLPHIFSVDCDRKADVWLIRAYLLPN